MMYLTCAFGTTFTYHLGATVTSRLRDFYCQLKKMFRFSTCRSSTLPTALNEWLSLILIWYDYLHYFTEYHTGVVEVTENWVGKTLI